MNRKQLIGIVLTAVLGLTLAAVVHGETTEEWRFTLTPYVWLADVSIDMESRETVSLDADEILGSLELAVMVAAEARKDRLFVLGDLIYINNSGSKDDAATVPVGGGSVTADADLDVKTLISNFLLGYGVYQSERGNMDTVLGLRYARMDTVLKLHVASLGADAKVELENDLWNGVVGIRGNVKLIDSLFIPYYLDIGTGDSDFTWQAMAGLAYSFNDWSTVLLAYRHLSFQNDNKEVQEFSMSGPGIGWRIAF